ncbi:hypothetical protein M0805_009265 [Coniferiporia weirii]|nr:hypothetical protein M0805_009265 [Coniferiporia weirii]
MGSKKKRSKVAPTTPNQPPPQVVDDDELLDDLMARIDAKGATQQEASNVLHQVDLNSKANELETSSSKKDGRARFEARKLRKMAEQAALYSNDDKEADARLEREARDEERAIKSVCDDLGLAMFEINPDGHCLYAAIADQLRILGIIPSADAHYATARAAAAVYMAAHPDAFLPFLPSVEGEDSAGAGEEGVMGPLEFGRYCANVRSSAVWGGEPEILALSRAYGIPIHVVQAGRPSIVVHDPNGGQIASEDKKVVRISYHRRMYGLGEHYNSLRPRSLTQHLKAIIS